MADKQVIAVTRRGHDYKAELAAEPGCWGCGATPEAAVGDLVRSWPEKFGVEITEPGSTPDGRPTHFCVNCGFRGKQGDLRPGVTPCCPQCNGRNIRAIQHHNFEGVLLTEDPWRSELWAQRTYCKQCGRTCAENRAKYCGDGSDKNYSHDWAKMEGTRGTYTTAERDPGRAADAVPAADQTIGG